MGELLKRMEKALTSVWQNEEEKLRAKATIMVLSEIVEEMQKDIIVTERDLYKQAMEWGNKGELKVSAAFVRAADAIREKRKKWLGKPK